MNNNGNTSNSLLRGLLSRPSTSSAPPPPLEPLPSTSSTPPPSSSPAPPPSTLELPPPSSSPAPPPSTIEGSPPVIHIPDGEDNTWERVLCSTAHPNFWDPELHPMVVEELLGTAHYRLPSPRSTMGSPLPPSPTSLVSSLPPSPLPLSTSPPSSPPPQLPARRKEFSRLKHKTLYTVHSWTTQQNRLHCTVYNTEHTELYQLILPSNVRQPSKKLRLHHLFEHIYLYIEKINGKLHITFRS